MQESVKQFILNAKKKVQEKNFKGGLSEIEPALMLMKKNPEANMIGGFCYKELGLFEEAHDCYKTVFDQRPNDPVLLKRNFYLLKVMYELYLITDKKLAKETLEKMKEIFIKLDKQDKVAEILVKIYEINLEIKHFVNKPI